MIMNSKSIVRPVMLAVVSLSVLVGAALRGEGETSRWVHPLCQPLPVDSNGPFVELADGSLLTVDVQGMRISKDDGQSWSDAQSRGIIGRMRISYLARVSERSSRLLSSFISFFETMTPIG